MRLEISHVTSNSSLIDEPNPKSDTSDHEIDANANLVDSYDEGRPVTNSKRSRLNDDTDSFQLDQEIDYKTLYLKERNENANLKTDLKSLRKSLRASAKKSKWRLQSIVKHKNDNKRLKKDLKRLQKTKSEDHQLLQFVKSNPVIQNSLINLNKAPPKRRYNSSMRKFAVGTYLTGPAAYRYIQSSKVLALPSKMTIRRWTSDVRIKPGINDKILRRLEHKTKLLNTNEKVVTICIDGMSLKQELTYNAKTDMFIGFPDDGIKRKIERNNPLVLASEAVAVVVSGLTEIDSVSKMNHRRFKQVN